MTSYRVLLAVGLLAVGQTPQMVRAQGYCDGGPACDARCRGPVRAAPPLCPPTQVHVHIHQKKTHGHGFAPAPPQSVLVQTSLPTFSAPLAVAPQSAIAMAAAPSAAMMLVPVGVSAVPQVAGQLTPAAQAPSASALGIQCFTQAELQTLQSRLQGRDGNMETLRELLLTALKESRAHESQTAGNEKNATTAEACSTERLEQLEERYRGLAERVELLQKHAENMGKMTELLRKAQENIDGKNALRLQGTEQ